MTVIGKTVLYSTGCPKCKVLKSKLAAKGILFTEVNDVEEMLNLGIDTVPVLFHNNRRMEFKEAIEWVNSQ